jgi:hypothetical protein
MMIVENSMNWMHPPGATTPLSSLLGSIMEKIGRVDAKKEIEQVVPQLLVLRAFLRDGDSRSALDLLSVSDIQPLFAGWQPSDTDRLCFRKVKMEDLKGIYLSEPKGEEGTRGAGDTLIKSGRAETGVRFAFPTMADYPAIEGVAFGLLSDTNDPTKQYPLAVQMKCGGQVPADDVKEWARAAHDHVTKVLGFRQREYYVLLCVANLPSATSALPKGTLVVGPDFLEALCRPFGIGSALMEEIQVKRTTQEK